MRVIKVIIYLFCLSFSMLSCKNKDFINYKIDEISLVSNYFHQKKVKINIKNKEKVDYLVTRVKDLKYNSRKVIKPFKGSVLIQFIEEGKVVSYLSTGLIIKDENDFLFTNFKGYSENDTLAEEIIKIIKEKQLLIEN